MAQDRNEELGGPYMIQDRDHLVQQGGQTKSGKGRQSDQSQDQNRQQGGQADTTAQQGGGKTTRRSKLL